MNIWLFYKRANLSMLISTIDLIDYLSSQYKIDFHNNEGVIMLISRSNYTRLTLSDVTNLASGDKC